MSGFDWIKDAIAHLKRYAELGRICFGDVGRFEECDRVWAAVGIVLGVVGVVTLVFIATHFYREYSAHRRAWQRRRAELEVAAPDVMKTNANGRLRMRSNPV